MFDFPASPSIGQEYTSNGVSYIWNGYGWAAMEDDTGGTGGEFVNTSGDIMTGDLIISKDTPGLGLNRVGVPDAQIRGLKDGLSRWTVVLGDNVVEGGGNIGSDFRISRYDDSGGRIGNPLLISRQTGLITIEGDPTVPLGVATKQYVDSHVDTGSYVLKTGDTMSGPLNITSASPFITLNKTSGAAYIQGANNGLIRWRMNLGLNVAEGGADTGSDFSLVRYSDAAAVIGGINISRKTGLLTTDGDIRIDKSVPKITINGIDAGGAYLTAMRGGSARWNLLMAYGAGADFYIQACDDTGTVINNPLTIKRADSTVEVARDPLLPLGVATKQYVDARVGSFVLKTGDTMTGGLTTPAVNVTGQDSLSQTVVNGAHARLAQTVTGVRTWYTGPQADGAYYIRDASTNVRMSIDLAGTVSFQGNAVYAGSFNGVFNGNVNGNCTGTSGGIAAGGIIDVTAIEGVQYMDFRYAGHSEDYCARFQIQNDHQLTCFTPRFSVAGGYINSDTYISSVQGYLCNTGGAGPGYTFAINWPGGALYISGTYVGNVVGGSDYRIKKDIIDLTSMWDTVKGLRPIRYTHRDYTPASQVEIEQRTGVPFVAGDEIERWGFVAHELQETLIESAATAVKDAPNAIQSPDPMTVIAALTKALQEAMTRIEQLETATGI